MLDQQIIWGARFKSALMLYFLIILLNNLLGSSRGRRQGGVTQPKWPPSSSERFTEKDEIWISRPPAGPVGAIPVR